jgi:hypothetical protein
MIRQQTLQQCVIADGLEYESSSVWEVGWVRSIW